MPATEEGRSPAISIVIPCLNEEQTLGLVLREVREAFENGGAPYETIVADNGSTDRSREIAVAHGARVVSVARPGYGAALDAGIRAATGELVLMGDADHTYRFLDGPRMADHLRATGADLVIGMRLGGHIEPRAMPFLHRYLGTPVLTWFINRLYGARISDCNSGFRCFRKASYLSWGMRSDGMEFASEMIINACLTGARIEEVKTTLRRDVRVARIPHLRTWRDGMRHLLFILSHAPHAFWHPGLWLFGISLIIMGIGLTVGPVTVGGVRVFDIHTLGFATLIGFIGASAMRTGLALQVQIEDRRPAHGLPRRLLAIPEDVLFLTLLVLGAVTLGGVLAIVWTWAARSFQDLDQMRLLLFCIYVTVVLGSFAFGLLHAHMSKRSRPRC